MLVAHIVPNKGFKTDGIIDYQVKVVDALKDLAPSASAVQCTFNEAIALKADIIHLQLPMRNWKWNPFIFLDILKYKRRVKGGKAVTTLHEWDETHVVRRIIQYPIIYFSDVITVPTKKLLKSIGVWLPAKAEKAIVIPIGPNIEFYDASQAASEDIDAYNICHFGYIYEAKKPLTVLKIFHELIKQDPRFRLNVVGDFLDSATALRTEFFRDVKSLGLEGKIVWHGYIPDKEEASQIMRRAGSFIALHRRGFTMRNGSSLAALSYGRPVFVSAPSPDDAREVSAYLNQVDTQNLLKFINDKAEDGLPAIARDIILSVQNAGPSRREVRMSILWEISAERHVQLYASLVER